MGPGYLGTELVAGLEADLGSVGILIAIIETTGSGSELPAEHAAPVAGEKNSVFRKLIISNRDTLIRSDEKRLVQALKVGLTTHPNQCAILKINCQTSLQVSSL